MIYPIGIYRTPPPADAQPGIKFLELADIGVVPLAERTTALSNYLLKKARGILT